MKLIDLTLTNFRKISSLPQPTITFNPDINVLVGANNSGKTSILKAIQKLFKTEEVVAEKDLNYLVKDGKLIVESKLFLKREEWDSYLAISDNTTISKKTTENLNKSELIQVPIAFKRSWNFIKRKESSHSNIINYDQIIFRDLYPNKTPESHIRRKRALKIFSESNVYNVYNTPLYLDSKGELLDREPFLPLNQIENSKNLKQPNIRGALYALKRKDPTEFRDLQKRLLEIFTELEDIDVRNNEELGQFELVLHEKLKRNGNFEEVVYDINNVGQGMQSLVIMLSTILLLKPSIVLMDEPEVHMHPSLIKEFVKYIKLLSVDIQFIITTHSLVLIQEVGLDKIFSLSNEVEQKGIIVSKVDTRNKLLETINTLGYDIDALTYTIKPSVYVFTEGITDKDLILAFAEKAGFSDKINSFKTAFIEMNGKGNRYKLANLIDKLNEEFIDSPLIMILDKDETTHTSIEDIRNKFFKDNPKRLHYLNKRQIENYLIDAQAIKNLVSKKIKDTELNTKWLAEDIDAKVFVLAEEQKEKIQENFIDELFINESLVKTEDLRMVLKTLRTKPLNESVREFSAELSKLVTLRTFDLGQKTSTSVEEFEKNWNNERNKIEMSDGRELLKSLRRWVQEVFKVSFSNEDIVEAMVKIPEEIHSLLVQLTKPEELKIKI